MENEQRVNAAEAMDHRDLAVALLDISADVRRKSHEDTGVRPLPNGAVDILRLVEGGPGITVAEVAARLGRQFSNVSVQLRELVAANLVTRLRDPSDKRYVTLHPTEESQQIRAILETSWPGSWLPRRRNCSPESSSSSPPASPHCSGWRVSWQRRSNENLAGDTRSCGGCGAFRLENGPAGPVGKVGEGGSAGK